MDTTLPLDVVPFSSTSMMGSSLLHDVIVVIANRVSDNSHRVVVFFIKGLFWLLMVNRCAKIHLSVFTAKSFCIILCGGGKCGFLGVFCL